MAYLLRFEFVVPDQELHNAIQQLPYVVLVQLGALALAGVYSFIWRYVGLGEVKAFIYAATWSALVLAVLRLSLPDTLRHLARPALRHPHGDGSGVRRRARAAGRPALPLRALATQDSHLAGGNRRRSSRRS